MSIINQPVPKKRGGGGVRSEGPRIERVPSRDSLCLPCSIRGRDSRTHAYSNGIHHCPRCGGEVLPVNQ